MINLIIGTDPISSWWLAIIIVSAVTLIVAALLIFIIRTAAAIDAEVATIWANGQRVANNTIHIAVLYKTHEYVQDILRGAVNILGNSVAIRDHARSCPNCPKCIWHKI